MEVEVPPHIWCKELYAGIEGGRSSHNEHQQRGIERWNIVEMHYLGALPALPYHKMCDGNEAYHHKGNKRVLVGEERYELGDWVVGIDHRQQTAFMRPAKRQLLCGKLHPDSVGRVIGNDAYVSHNHACSLTDSKRIGGHFADVLLGLLAQQEESISPDDVVEVLGIVVAVGKID